MYATLPTIYIYMYMYIVLLFIHVLQYIYITSGIVGVSMSREFRYIDGVYTCTCMCARQ